jgi:hypothetical protein
MQVAMVGLAADAPRKLIIVFTASKYHPVHLQEQTLRSTAALLVGHRKCPLISATTRRVTQYYQCLGRQYQPALPTRE